MKYLLIALLTLSSTAFAEHFKTGSDVPTEELKLELVKFYKDKIEGNKIYSLTIEGHTDVRGGESYNQRLSERRAESSFKMLRNLGLDTGKVETRLLGMGKTQPISNNDDDNRRIVLKVKSSAGTSTTVIQDNKKCTDKVVTKEVVREVVKTTIVIKQPKKNRLSLLLGVGAERGLETEVKPSLAIVQERVGVVGGVQYQRLLNEDVSVGMQLQTNETLLLSVGVDF